MSVQSIKTCRKMHPKWSRISPTISADFHPNFLIMTWDAYFGLPRVPGTIVLVLQLLSSLNSNVTAEGFRRNRETSREQSHSFRSILENPPRSSRRLLHFFHYIFRFGLVAVRAGEITRRIHIEPAACCSRLSYCWSIPSLFPPSLFTPSSAILHVLHIVGYIESERATANY